MTVVQGRELPLPPLGSKKVKKKSSFSSSLPSLWVFPSSSSESVGGTKPVLDDLLSQDSVHGRMAKRGSDQERLRGLFLRANSTGRVVPSLCFRPLDRRAQRDRLHRSVQSIT